jgi:hypothetical protein
MDADTTISDQAELDTLREGIDDPMVLKAQLAKEAEARRQLTARAKNAEAENRDLKTKLAEVESKDIITPSTQPKSVIIDEAVELRLDGYTKQETEWIIQNGGRKVLEDPNSLVSIALKASREQRAAEEASSAVSSTVGLSEIERKYTPEQLRNMSVKELEAILPRAS